MRHEVDRDELDVAQAPAPEVRAPRLPSRPWSRWSPAKTVSAALLVGAFGWLALSLTWGRGDQDEYRLLESGERQDLRHLTALLEARGLRWRQVPDAGHTRLEVHSDDYRQAVMVAGASGLALKEMTTAPASSGGLFDTGYNREQAETIRRMGVEESILFNPRIARVRFLFAKEREALFEREEKRTAAVGLDLSPGVDRLSAAEIRNIRQLVAGACQLSEDDIQIVDGSGNLYPSPKGAWAAEDAAGRVREELREMVEGLFLGPYSPAEFRLTVSVLVDSSETRVEEVRTGTTTVPTDVEEEDASWGRPGWRRRREEVVRESETRRTTNAPAGRVTAVRLGLYLDLDAVRRTIEQRRTSLSSGSGPVGPYDLGRAIEEYAAEQGELLAEQIPYPGTQVSVVPAVLKRPVTTVVPAEIVPEPEFLSRAAEWLATVDRRVVAAVLAAPLALALLLGWILLRRSRRSLRRSGGDVPEVDPRSCQTTLMLAREASRLAAERPEMAQAILRFWLASADRSEGEEPRETPIEETDDVECDVREAVGTA